MTGPQSGETARCVYGSVLPGATEPDVFYETFEDAVADCAFGPCRIVRRVLGPWVPVGQSITSPPANESGDR